MGVESQLFNTKSNYNSKGNEEDLLINRSYKLMSGRVYAGMDWNEQLRAYVSGGYAQATSSNGLLTNAGEQTGSGLTDVEVKAYWESGFRPWFFRPLARFAFPIQRVGLNTRTPIYAEGAMEFEGGARIGYYWKSFTPYAQASLLYRDEGRTSLLPWHIGIQYKYKAFISGLELHGQEILKSDSKASDPRDKQTVVDYSDGGSYKFYFIDSKYYEARGYIGAEIMNKVTVRLGAGQTLMGKNAAAGQTYLVNVEFRFGEEKADPRQDRFEAVPESYEQKLFQEEITPNPRAPKRSNSLDKEFDKIVEQPITPEAQPLPPVRRQQRQRQQPQLQSQPPQKTKAKAKASAVDLEKEFETMKVEKPRPTKKEIKKQRQQKQMLDDVERELERN